MARVVNENWWEASLEQKTLSIIKNWETFIQYCNISQNCNNVPTHFNKLYLETADAIFTYSDQVKLCFWFLA